MILKNQNHFILPADIIKKLGKIHEYIGQNRFYSDLTLADKQKIIKNVIMKDAYFLALLMNLNVSEQRMRLIITRDSKARTNQEQILYNLKILLNNYQNHIEKINDNPQSLQNLGNYLFKGENIHLRYIKDTETGEFKSTEIKLKEIYDNFISLKDYHETISLVCHYFLDIRFIEAFSARNDIISLLILYYNLLNDRVDALEYVSFFELIYEKREDLKQEIQKANINWSEGISQTLDFIRFICDIIIILYEKRNNEMLEYEIRLNENKSDNLEDIILAFENEFNKNDIRQNCPYVSESTINRVLFKLNQENKISSLGKGRGARWKISK